MKTLKFTEHLVDMILSGEKKSTWRLFDDKDLKEGDELSFINKQNNQEFAKSKIIKIAEKKLGDINDNDFEGHEKFESREIMFDTYRKYYGDKVSDDTIVKMIDFEITDIKINEGEVRIACAVIYNPNTKTFLLQHRTSDAPTNPNKWSLFGGHLEDGETLIQALLRELEEEIGVIFKAEEVKFLYQHQTRPGRIVNVFLIECFLSTEDITLGEGQGFDFVSVDKMLDYDLSDQAKKNLTDFLRLT
jgi:8-oxo-dGTP diphosphatase